jgi:hypothetical protein
VPKQRAPLNDVLDSNKTVRPESAEEATNANGSAKPPGTTESSEQPEVALASEQPVPSVPEEKISQYVVTVDNESGLLVKVEKLTAAGERKELSQEEYEQAELSSVAGGEGSSEFASSANDSSVLTAYYQGVNDYLNSLT